MKVGAYLPTAAVTIAVERNGAGKCKVTRSRLSCCGQAIFTRFSVKETDAFLFYLQNTIEDVMGKLGNILSV